MARAGDYATNTFWKPLALKDTTKSVLYYVAWLRAYNSDTVFVLSPYSLKKYSDGTWPFFTDAEKQIRKKFYSSGANTMATPVYFGYFLSLDAAKVASMNFQENSRDAGLIVRAISVDSAGGEQNKSGSGNFWNN